MGEIIADPKLLASLVSAILITASLIFFFAHGFMKAMREEREAAKFRRIKIWSGMPPVPDLVPPSPFVRILDSEVDWAEDFLSGRIKRHTLDLPQTVRIHDRSYIARQLIEADLMTFEEGLHYVRTGERKKGKEKWRV